MAEELIIHVKIDGFSPQKNQQNRSSTRNESGALAAGAIGAALDNKNPLDVLNYKAWNEVHGHTYAYQDRTTRRIAKEVGFNMSNVGLVPGTFGGYRDITLSDATGSITQTQETLWGKVGGAAFLQENQRKVKAAGSALAWKAADSAVNVAKHKSGDAYANAQLNNAMKVVGYGTAIAMSGPAAPLVAAGIAVNEIANGIVEGINYRFDRALEGDQIRNMKVIAGDVSYGRRRGAL